MTMRNKRDLLEEINVIKLRMLSEHLKRSGMEFEHFMIMGIIIDGVEQGLINKDERGLLERKNKEFLKVLLEVKEC